MHLKIGLKISLIGLMAVVSQYLPAQSLTGFYTGQIKLVGNRAEMGAQLDLIEKDGVYNAILRTRFIENNVITGCDNLLIGKLQNDQIIFKHLVNIKETDVPPGSCDYFETLKLSIDKKATTPAWSGNIVGSDGQSFGRVRLERIDEENSFSIVDEINIAKRKLGEVQIASERSDSVRIQLMLTYRSANIKDTVTVKAGETIFRVEAPEADLFHKLTMLVNGNPIIVNKAPKQQPIQIRFEQLIAGDLEILLLCNHALVDVDYPLTLTILSPNGSQVLNTRVSTFQNTGIFVKVVP